MEYLNKEYPNMSTANKNDISNNCESIDDANNKAENLNKRKKK